MKEDLDSIENFGFTIRKNKQNDYENVCPSGQSCCIPKPKKLVCDENDGYKCHPSKVCIIFQSCHFSQFDFQFTYRNVLQK